MISKYLEASILAFVQGFSEFIPVSSSAHLIIISKISNFSISSLQLDISLHLGSLLAITFYFRKDLVNIFHNKDLAYLIFILLLSFFFYKKKPSAKSFILGHGNIPNWVVSMSIFATFVSSISYLALPGSSFNNNWNPFVFSLSIPLASIMAIIFFVPIYRRMKSTSAYSYLENRFGLWARIYASLCYTLTQIVRVGTILYLLAISLNFILGWKINMVIILTGVFVLIYSLLGGITAVLWTDAIQGIILIIGAIICFCLLYTSPSPRD